jgi:hypothetical protein
VHCHGLDTEFPAGTQDAQRNLAAIGYDDFIEHATVARYSAAR